MSDDSLNIDLVDSLLVHGIKHVFLFTDMTLHPPEIENRNSLIKELEEIGFAVHNVLTPNDLTWLDMDEVEAKQLHEWAFSAKLYTGKFYGPEFEAYVTSCSSDLPKMSEAIVAYRPERGAIGAGFSDACIEMHDTKTVSDNTRARSIFAKVFADHLSEKVGYRHCKGLLLDLFLRHRPDWVGSIVVIDDNKDVVADVTSFKPVSTLPMAGTLPPVSVVAITPEGIRQGQSYYDVHLADHMARHRAAVAAAETATGRSTSEEL